MDKSVMKFEIVSPQYRPKLRSYSATSGALVFGKFDGTLTVNGAGDYTITFKEQFTQVPQILVSVRGATRLVEIFSRTKSAVRIKISTVLGVNINGDFDLLALGSMAQNFIVGH